MKRTTLLSAVFLTLSLAVTSGVLGQSSEQIETSKASSAEEEGIKGVGKRSRFTRLVSAEQLERAGAQQFNEMKRQAARKQALAPATHPQVIRLRSIAQKIIPFTYRWNERAKLWQWEVNMFASSQVNAFCLPGGKIVFFTGILEKLKLTDDEAAMIMGHEIAHALREHARERMGKQMATQLGAEAISSFFGLGNLGRTGVNIGANLISLKFGREDESEADLVGLDLAARAGYDPRAGITLWQKMAQVNGGAPPEWLSTHPAGSNRIAEITKRLSEVMPLYARTQGKTVDQLPPFKTNMETIKPVN